MMTTNLPSTTNKIILRGVNLWLTDAMKAVITRKAERLYRHEPRIVRVRIGIDCEHRRTGREFCALGQVEVHGNDLLASVTDTNAYRAIDRMVQKLDRMLRRRTTAQRRSRATDDIRAHLTVS
jgi:putative sigma-54 modulation protein